MDAILRSLDVSRHLEFIKTQEIKGTGRICSEAQSETNEKKCAKHEVGVEYKPLSYREAIYLATLGGAEALSLDHITGNFSVGKMFDALIIDESPMISTFRELRPTKTEMQKLQEQVERFIFVGDDRNITQVFVSGKRIK